MNYCFYLDWHGLTPSEWAAWAQAILSGLGIFAAVFIATGQERRAKRSKIDAYVEIVSEADSRADSEVRFLEVSLGHPIRTQYADEWSVICKVFESIPFHDVPDFRLYSILRDAGRSSREIRSTMEPLFTSDDVVTDEHLMLVREESRVLNQCYLDAIEISNKLKGLNLRGRYNYAKASIRGMWRQWIENRKKT